MACCAFAAFLISQLILALDRARLFLGFAPVVAASNPNVEWRLGAPVAAVPPERPFRLAALPVTLGAVALGLVAGVIFGGADGSGHMFAFDVICTRDGLVSLAALSR